MNVINPDTAAVDLNIQCADHDALLLPLSDGAAVVLDRFRRRGLVLSEEQISGNDRAAMLKRVAEFLGDDVANRSPDLYPDLYVHLVGEFPLPSDALKLAEHIVVGCDGRIDARLVVHANAFSADPAVDFEQITERKILRGRVRLRGRFPVLSDEIVGRMINHGIVCSEIAGWWPGCGRDESLQLESDRIARNAELGLQVPVIWYVHTENLPRILELIEESLQANWHSGFSILPACLSPAAALTNSPPQSPNPSEFCALLVRAYQRFPHYDDVFEPLLELARNVRHGGWHRWFSVPRPLNLLVTDRGDCRLFRQLPAGARDWSTVSDVLAMNPGTAVDSLVDAARRDADFASHPFCCRCNWQYVCGGMDKQMEQEPCRSDAEVVCSYRQLFSEFFTRQKWAGQQSNGD